MTIEPHHAYTVTRRSVLPPKPAHRILSPKMSMAEDAELVRARSRARWPSNGDGAANREHLQRRASLIASITDLLRQHGPMTIPQLRGATDTTKSQMRRAIRQMQDSGFIVAGECTRDGQLWRLA